MWIHVDQTNSSLWLVTRPSRRQQPSLEMQTFFFFVFRFFFWCCAFATCAVRSLLRQCFLGGHGDGEQLGWFVFIRIRNTKPWNHFHMCTVVLWTKIVVEFMLLWSGLQR